MKLWKTVSRKVVLNHSKYLSVEVHTIELPDGRVITDWPWVVTPDYVNVVAVTNEGRFLCFRQTKYSVPGESLAPVGGYIEPGEEPLAAAKRELREETGYEASRWTHLGSYPIDANRGAGTAHFFLAQDAILIGVPIEHDLEEQQIQWLDRAAMEAALRQGEFKVLPWAAAVALALGRI